ncbi:MAG: O-antigen ligase family protein, partial [Chthonomonadales bacterium]
MRAKTPPPSLTPAPGSIQIPPAVYAPISLMVFAVLILTGGFGGMLYDRFNPSSSMSSLAQIAAIPIGVILAALAGMMSLRNAKHIRVPIWQWLIGVAMIVSVGTAFFSHDTYTSFTLVAYEIGAVFLAIGVSYMVRQGHGRISAIWFALSSVFVSVQGLQEYVIRLRDGDPNWRVFANFAVPNFLAGYLLIGIGMTLALLITSKATSQRILCAFGLLLQIVVLILTGSRFGMMAFAAEAILFVSLMVRANVLPAQTKKGIFIGAVGLVIVFAIVGRPLLRRLLDTSTQGYSAQFRVLTWKGAAALSMASPIIGNGPGTFEIAYPKYAKVGYTQHAHNSYLQFAGEIGWPATICLILGCFAILGRALRNPTPPEDGAEPVREMQIILVGAVAGVVGLLVHNLFDSDFYVPAIAISFAAALGWINGATPSAPSNTDGKIPTRAIKIFAGAVGVLIVLHATRQFAGRVQARSAADSFDLAKSMLRQGTTDPSITQNTMLNAIDEYKISLGIDPGNGEVMLNLASLYQSLGKYPEAAESYVNAQKSLGSGKSYYRQGRMEQVRKRLPEAVELFKKSLEIEPNNLQALLTLGSCYQELTYINQARATYQKMETLYKGDIGKIRALPELPDWEFGVA